MDFLPGPTVLENIEDGIPLSESDALKICDAYIALREIKPVGDELCPSGSWPIVGHVFFPDNEGGLTMNSRLEFNDYITNRLTRAHEGMVVTLPEAGEYTFNYGDLSPSNIKLLPDGRVGFCDMGMAFWGPPYWDMFALVASGYDMEFRKTLLDAFQVKGILLAEETKEKMWKLMIWHGLCGNAIAL
jgi:hypothetical protein